MPESTETRIARLEEQAKALDRTVATFAPAAGQAIVAAAGVEAHDREMAETRAELVKAETRIFEAMGRVESRFKEAVEKVEKACNSLGAQLERREDRRAGTRGTITAAAMTASGALAAIVLERLL